MDNRKFCFIICSNDELYLEECLFYLQKLYIPEGYTVDYLSINHANSMTAGYNEGMKASDAKYKIYIHHDVFILNINLLEDLLKIFTSDDSIGMIGLVGSLAMPVDGVMWHGYRVGGLYGTTFTDESYDTYCYNISDGLHDVDAIDGLFMATSKDITWREDLFDQWDFYDISKSFEMSRSGFRVVVPTQNKPWCLHDDGILNLRNYDKYRKICLQEYKEFFERTDDESLNYNKK